MSNVPDSQMFCVFFLPHLLIFVDFLLTCSDPFHHVPLSLLDPPPFLCNSRAWCWLMGRGPKRFFLHKPVPLELIICIFHILFCFKHAYYCIAISEVYTLFGQTRYNIVAQYSRIPSHNLDSLWIIMGCLYVAAPKVSLIVKSKSLMEKSPHV